MEAGVAAGHGWRFKAKLRAHAFGWRGSALAVTRLKEAVSEIKAVAKSDPVTAGEGAVSLMERIWPAFQDIDTSSGALGTAVAGTLEQLIPVLVEAPADHAVRAKWLERLFDAVQEDGVQYLAPVEEKWGEIARYPDLINAFADRLLPVLRRAWADQERFSYVTGTAIGLSCLLEAGRYAELQDLLATQRMRFWSWHRFGAEALLRQGFCEAAIAYAETSRDPTGGRYEDRVIDRFCEGVLRRQGRSEEAYRRYGLRAAGGATNLAVYRALVRAYPDRDRRGILFDLVETRGEKGKWFAAAKDAGFLDLALDCAAEHDADPATLVRAARDFRDTDPRFAVAVALLAVRHLLAGGGYDPAVSDTSEAIRHLLAAACRFEAADWARQELDRLAEAPCAPGREPFRQAVRTALSCAGT
jgi:hypothetical protein